MQWASLLVLFFAILSLSMLSNVPVDHNKHNAISHLVTMTISKNSTHSAHVDGISCQPALAHFTQMENESHSDNLISIKHDEQFRLQFTHGHILILIQCLISSMANIYNEKIFKDGDGLTESIYVQNSKLYLFGSLFNALSLAIHREYRDRILHCGFFYGYNTFSVLLIFTTAFYGLNVSLILKFRDNMFHLMSSQIITVTVIAFSMYFFRFRPSLNFFLLSPIVLLCIYIFSISRSTKATTNAPYMPARQVGNYYAYLYVK